ncbi:MAG: hypothetical protein HOO94_12925 [Novosphingobium sp.]|nr:hypothetical protein [Novosphingobium sp.]
MEHTSDNRFLSYAATLERPAARRRARNWSSAQSYAHAFAASDRALVVLIENGGIDLDLAGLVDVLINALPMGNLITAGMRRDLTNFLQDKIRELTDTLLESADLALNQFGKARPGHYDSVAVLRDGTASYSELKDTLFTLSKAGKMIDLLILTHGGTDYISVGSGINGQKIRDMKTEFGRPLNLRSVYMMNCVGSSLNQAWIDAGAKAACGAIRNNYLPEPTTHFFWTNWQGGETFEAAAINAYRKTVGLMNTALRSFVSGLPIPGSSLLASKIDFEKLQFVIDSAPVIQGQRSVTIASDSLSFTQSLSSSLATTVVPTGVLDAIAARTLSTEGEIASRATYRYVSPSSITLDPANLSRQQNPAAPVIAGIAIADAIQIGLGAAAIAQAGITSVSGSFSLTYDMAQRLLVNEARQAMPGSQTGKRKYSTRLFWIGELKAGFADADVIIEWEGNDYGEIGSAVIRKDIKKSSDWSKSSCNITIRRVERIPAPGTDPREWPITYTYDGTFDPMGNGLYEFSGEFEINAFGGLHFVRHDLVSHSFSDFMKIGSPEDYVKRGSDIVVATPQIPDEQVKYLKSKLP